MKRVAAAGALALLAACSTTSASPAARPVSSPAASAAATPEGAAGTSEQPAASATPDTAHPTRQAACVHAMPLPERVGQVVWPAVTGDELRTRAADVRRWGVGGVVLMTWTKRSTAADLQALKAAAAIPLLVATDEEGGTVQRMEAFGVLPSARSMAKRHSVAEAEQLVAQHAAALHEVGIDVAFAPVVDVSPQQGGGPIGSRSFSRDPQVVADYAAAYVRAWHSAGILAVLKHFPGHGSASADTHTAAGVTPPLEELRQRDLVPYTALVGTGAAVMVGHLTVPGLTETGVPASLSPKAITGLLRGELGYADTLVFTDALGMDAVAKDRTLPQAAVDAIRAGADVAIFSATDQTDAVLAALNTAVAGGTISEQRLDDAVGRVLLAKHVDPCALGGVRSSTPG